MQSQTISFVGDGWGAVAAVKSLGKHFLIHYLTYDNEVINILSSQNGNIRVDKIEDLKNEIIVFAGYNSIVKTEIINKYTAINIHYSLLPKYRGLHSTAWEILNGEEELGVSIHLMTTYIDDGPIIFQKSFKNDDSLTLTNYMQIKNKFIAENLGRIILKFLNNEILTLKQNKKEASWVGRRGVQHNFINFNQEMKYIRRLFRVLSPPYPYPLIKYKSCLYNIKEIEFHNSNIITDNGRILNLDNDGVWVKNKDGYVILKKIIDENNQIIPPSFFKIGHYLND